MKRLFYLLAACAAFLAGCEDEKELPDATMVYKEYLIDAYIAPERLHIWDPRSGELWLTMTGPEYAVWSTGAAYEEFLRLASLHGGRIDREIEVDPFLYSSYGKGGFACYTESFASVEITCDQAVDEAHPAGSSLNDLCFFGCYTYAPFIRSGNTGHEIFDIWKPMDQITQEDMTMIAYCGMRIWLRFVLKPGFTCTVTLTTASGRTLTAQCFREPTS